jgi:hypothetical protein
VSVEGGRCSCFDGITSFKRDSALLKDTGAGGLILRSIYSNAEEDQPIDLSLAPKKTDLSLS